MTSLKTYHSIAAVCCLFLFKPLDTEAADVNGASFTAVGKGLVNYISTSSTPIANCGDFNRISDVNHSVISARLIPAEGGAVEHCEIHGVIAPEIQYIVNLPAKWNRRLYMIGNGGFGGQSVISDYAVEDRAKARRLGFVTAFTNTGHGEDAHFASWAHNNIQKEIDYGYRSIHLTAVIAKQLSVLYYGKAPAFSYFEGCSGGGRQGLVAAQRFPGDFDGIAVGAPFYDLPAIEMQSWWNQETTAKTTLTAERVRMLGNFIMDEFDSVDGVNDRVIDNPLAIDFEPARDLPRDASGEQGFTDEEIEAFTRIYQGPRIENKQIAPGLPIGAELPGVRDAGRTYEKSNEASPWSARVYQEGSGYNMTLEILESWLKYMAFPTDNPDYDWQQLDLKNDLELMQTMGHIMNAKSKDLSPYMDRGNKILMYHGWADVGVSPIMTVQYYEQVMQTMGLDTQSFFRTFMVPGMFHCSGGRNVDHFDVMTTLIDWVEAGLSPDRIDAARIEEGKVVRTRPLCPYPQVARYRKRGSTDKAENFVCALPNKKVNKK
ncbi:MAG: tannase/feruloyl esterase family alpha/beta hydrolase [Gammaproteobacteria bacterium]|jgi:hypothetical protein|nr:tannase/feruloyl esterase family alpha/beta hydrolase [Gammaproteobacteria bacterium]